MATATIDQDNRSILNQIGVCLGLSEKESAELAEFVYAGYYKINEGYKDLSDRPAIPLFKLMVRRCIFRISTEVCSGSFVIQKSLEKNSGGYYNDFFHYSEMPLTCKTVYILSRVIGFADTDVADMLNITPNKVRERLTRSLSLLKKHRT